MWLPDSLTLFGEQAAFLFCEALAKGQLAASKAKIADADRIAFTTGGAARALRISQPSPLWQKGCL
jgi:hypothetical protein